MDEWAPVRGAGKYQLPLKSQMTQDQENPSLWDEPQGEGMGYFPPFTDLRSTFRTEFFHFFS